MKRWAGKRISLFIGMLLCLVSAGVAFAATPSGVGAVALNVVGNMSGIAKLITAGAYVAGFGFVVAAIVKFKAHKDNPTQVMISMPIALLFVGAALIFCALCFQGYGWNAWSVRRRRCFWRNHFLSRMDAALIACSQS